MTDPLWQPQVLPQPSDIPPRLPSAGQLGAQHAPMYSALPFAHAHVPPQPSDIPPLLPSAGHVGLQQLPPYRIDPLWQPQVLPQPSGIPPRLPSDGQFGVQQPLTDIRLPVGHGHLPLQPSSIPAQLPSAGQVGVHWQAPHTQRPFLPQFCAPQSQVSIQTPLLHTLPAAHFTPAHRFRTQVPPLHSWLAAHFTPAQGLLATQDRLQACPAPHAASQALSMTHLPVAAEQYCPDGQTTPLHGSGKHPATHSPSEQVCPLAQVTPAQRSATATQLAWQLVPDAQLIAVAARQGSAWQAPFKQTWPVGQVCGQLGVVVPPPSRPPVPAAPPRPVSPRASRPIWEGASLSPASTSFAGTPRVPWNVQPTTNNEASTAIANPPA